jgi:hypothetical protein
MLVFACAEDEGAEIIKIEFSEIFKIAYNETAIIDNGQFSLHFSDVISDSRCPIYANCVWIGALVVRLEVNNAVIELSNINHNTVTQKIEIVSGEYRITFMDEEILPIPLGFKEKALEEYQIYLKVEKI